MSYSNNNSNLPAILDPKLDMLTDRAWEGAMQYLDRRGECMLDTMGDVRFAAIISSNMLDAHAAVAFKADQYIRAMPDEKRRISRLVDELDKELIDILHESRRR